MCDRDLSTRIRGGVPYDGCRRIGWEDLRVRDVRGGCGDEEVEERASEASTDAGPEGNGRVRNGGGCVGHPRGGDVRPAREYSGSRYRSGMLGKAAVY